MDRLSSHEVVVMFLALGTLLGAARILGELARRVNQPAVIGEILAGVLLGPTVLGQISPELLAYLFPPLGHQAVVLDGLTTLAVALFLLVAGMEVDLSTIWRQGKAASAVSLTGIVFPFTIGLFSALLMPNLLGREATADPWVFALFFATALSISALPVIAKTLMDLGLYRSDLGMVVIAAAICNDLIGWIIFAVILAMIATDGGASHSFALHNTILLTLGFAAFMLTVGRWLIHRLLPLIQAHTTWPGGVLGFILTAALFCSALTEWIGVHAIFGAFMFGVALGDSSHLREQTRTTIDRFISFIFAPLFFASIGLKVNFAADFDLLLVVVVLLIACVGKIGGCLVGGRWGGLSWRHAWAVGFGMNARGAMEIILGLLALHAGVIREQVFVALVIMALVTSIMSGPVMQRLLREKKAKRFTDYLPGKLFFRPLEMSDRWEAIRKLANAVADTLKLDHAMIEEAVRRREQIMSTGLPNGVAVPHARLPALTQPIIAVGICDEGVDFQAADGNPSRLVLLILTPSDDGGDQLRILADIAGIFQHRATVERAVACQGYTEFLALINSVEVAHKPREG